MTRKEFRFCPACATPYESAESWPRTCRECRYVVYRNPTPLGIVVVPIEDGVLGIRRADGAFAGGMALPGGTLEAGETWEFGAARELREETGIIVEPDELTHLKTLSSSFGDGYVLIFGLAKPRPRSALDQFTPNSEVAELRVIKDDEPLCFETHVRVLKDYFAEFRGGRR